MILQVVAAVSVTKRNKIQYEFRMESDNKKNKSTVTAPAPVPFYGSWNRVLLKLKYSFYSTMLFFLFANPETYRVMQNILGKVVSITDGISSCNAPTVTGFFIHTGLFFVTMFSLMIIPSDMVG